MHQRGGDLVAAVCFIKSVLAQAPDMEFEWVIKRDISSHQKNLNEFIEKELGALSSLVHLTVLDSSDYSNVAFNGENVIDKASGTILSHQKLTALSDANWGLIPHWHGWTDVHQQLRSKQLSFKFSAARAIVVVANPHRLVKEDHKVLHEYKKKIYIVPEYSLYHSQNRVYYPGDSKLSTGFAEAGVYIDEVVKFQGGFEHVDASDQSFLEQLLRADVAEKNRYQASTDLFYGYFFENEQLSSSSYAVKIKSFIQNAIMLVMDRDKKPSIDIVIPGFADANALREIYRQAILGLPKSYLAKIRAAEYQVKNTSNKYDAESLHVGNGAFAVRLINPRRLQRVTIQTLLNEADPFVGLTGDASWIEGLMKGKITCYQVVRWKEEFYQGFMAFLNQKFPSNSPLYQFYALQNRYYGQASELNWDKMRALYVNHKAQMLAEAKLLAHYIEQEKDLNKTLFPAFIRDIRSVHDKPSLATPPESFLAPASLPDHVVEEIPPQVIPLLASPPPSQQHPEIDLITPEKNSLLRIVKQLIENISDGKDNRWTAGKCSVKIKYLDEVKIKLDTQTIWDKDVQDAFICEIRKISNIKRHAIHFWSTPHSVLECERMLVNAGLVEKKDYPLFKSI